MNNQLILQGFIKNITYINNENSYTVADSELTDTGERITVTGYLPGVSKSENLEIHGDWFTHKKYGRQFRISKMKIIVPKTAKGIEKFLASGLIKSIGPKMARTITEKFAEKTMDIFENNIDLLLKISGIGKKRLQTIKTSWNKHKENQDILIFFHGLGISQTLTFKIFKQYGQGAIQKVKQNPYCLVDEVGGIGFLTADRIALNMGIATDSSQRIRAGIMYVLSSQGSEGHVYYPYEKLVDRVMSELKTKRSNITVQISELIHEKKLIIEDLNSFDEEMLPNNKAVYLAYYYYAECNISEKLKQLLKSNTKIIQKNIQLLPESLKQNTDIQLTHEQLRAIELAVKHKVMVLTGGPGTGKTTIIKIVLEHLQNQTHKIQLAAPTGRAAKRLGEATGREAKTIHRLLEWDFEINSFKKNTENPLKVDFLIIDEASMIDTILMYHLLSALPITSHLLLVGDINQLPSVNAGNVLSDLISSELIPVFKLRKIHRQASNSLIITNAHRIHQGEYPVFPVENSSQDFYFIERNDAQEVQNTIIELVHNRIPARFHYNSKKEIQVLTPMRKGILGVETLNVKLQQVLNPPIKRDQNNTSYLQELDKVMQVKNNYEKDIYNGDIGLVKVIDRNKKIVQVDFEGKIILYDFQQLDELVLAYAISIHKSQGSEYPAVIICLHTSHYIMLQRNLIYTALTRAKKLAIIVGTKRALQIAINNDKVNIRYTGLREKLQIAK